MKKSVVCLFCILTSLLETSGQDHIAHPIGPPPITVLYQGNVELNKIYLMPANPEKGFHWPYYLGTPETAKDNVALLVEPNNDGKTGASIETHKYWASIKCEQALFDYGYELETFTLVPVFPRPKLDEGNNLYVHALTQAVIENKTDSLGRVDLQLLAMVEDAQRKIRGSNYQIANKFMLWGFSAAGDFVTRMAMIHPEKIQCIAAGGLGGLPILPIKKLGGDKLTYPVGIWDFERIFKKQFNAASFKSLPMKLFQGGDDENDSVPEGEEIQNEKDFVSDSYSFSQSKLINQKFGTIPVNRISKVSEIYSKFGMQSFSYVIVPNLDHRTEPFEADVLDFLKMHSIAD